MPLGHGTKVLIKSNVIEGMKTWHTPRYGPPITCFFVVSLEYLQLKINVCWVEFMGGDKQVKWS